MSGLFRYLFFLLSEEEEEEEDEEEGFDFFRFRDAVGDGAVVAFEILLSIFEMMLADFVNVEEGASGSVLLLLLLLLMVGVGLLPVSLGVR